MNSAVFVKTMKNVLFGARTKLSYKKISDNLLAIEMKRIQILMSKPVCLGR